MDTTVTLAIISIVATLVGSLIWVVKFLFEKLLPRIDQGNEVISKNNLLLAELFKSTAQNTEATKSADKYLKERNGRDHEMHEELIKAVKEIPAQIIKTATITAKVLQDSTIEQHVNTQTVEKQVVNKK